VRGANTAANLGPLTGGGKDEKISRTPFCVFLRWPEAAGTEEGSTPKREREVAFSCSLLRKKKKKEEKKAAQ